MCGATLCDPKNPLHGQAVPSCSHQSHRVVLLPSHEAAAGTLAGRCWGLLPAPWRQS